jgi:hypothetical protein
LPYSKATKTSSLISGKKYIPLSFPAMGVKILAQGLSSFSESQGNLTFILPNFSGSLLLVTMAIVTPLRP